MSDEGPKDRSVWFHLKRTWTTLFGIQALCLVIGLLVAGPVLTYAIEGVLAASSHTALSDTDIVTFVFSLKGLFLTLSLGALWLTLQLLGYATQLVAAHRSFHDDTPSVSSSLARVAGRLPSILALSLRFLVQVGAIALPFLVAIGVIAWLQLGQKDINYYLTARPPEFMLAVFLAGALALVMSFLVIRHAVGWMHALPLLLFGGEGHNTARIHSLEATHGQRKRIFTALAFWAIGTPLLIAPINIPWPPLALWIADNLQHRLGLLALSLAVLLAVSSGLALIVGFTTQSLLALYNLKLFRQAGLDPEEPPAQAVHSGNPLPWKLVMFCACVGLVVAGFLCHQRLEQLGAPDKAVIIAHRGASADAPENTLAAIELAIAGGTDWVEIDVQETATGEVLVFHDRDFMRMARNPLTLRNATADDIANIDIGSWFSKKFADERTPTLKQVLELCRDRTGVLIELKYYGSEEKLEQRVIDIVEQCDMASQVMVMSLKLEGVEKVRELRPKWPVGLLSTVSLGDLTRLDVDFLGLNAASASDRLVDRAHRANIEVFVWTVNEPAAMSAMLGRGVDGLITDRPRVCRKVLDERATLNPGERILIDLASRVGRPTVSDSP